MFSRDGSICVLALVCLFGTRPKGFLVIVCIGLSDMSMYHSFFFFCFSPGFFFLGVLLGVWTACDLSCASVGP